MSWLKQRQPLRVDWLDRRHTGPGRLGLTSLPGRKDHGRSLPNDLAALKEQGVSHVACLLTENEFSAYGVDNLLDAYEQAGLATHQLPIPDYGVCSPLEMAKLVQSLACDLAEGAGVLIHCVGGLGRSGLVAACYLKSRGLGTEKAIAEVRQARSPLAIESAVQEAFIHAFAGFG